MIMQKNYIINKQNQTQKNVYALRLTLYDLLYILVLLLMFFFVSCDNNPSELKELTHAIESESEFTLLNLRLHLAPSVSKSIKITKVVLTVTGPGIEAPIVENSNLQNKRQTNFVLLVPVGANRLFVAEAFDENRVVLRKEQTIDLPFKKPEALVMRLELVSDIILPQEIVHEKDGSTMLLIPAGEFVMGSSRGGEPDEYPQHRVYLSSFYIDKFEITNEQYEKFRRETGHQPPKFWDDPRFNKPNQPVVGVSFQDAVTYCQWAGKRLPTEAEWEKAARGTEGQIYPWGNNFDWTMGNFGDNGQFDGHIDGFAFTAPVSSFPEGASPYGVQDMAGNVWEWCADWYQKDYYHISPPINPKGPDTGIVRVQRGGSFFSALYIRCSARYYLEENSKYFYAGFRCASDIY